MQQITLEFDLYLFLVSSGKRFCIEILSSDSEEERFKMHRKMAPGVGFAPTLRHGLRKDFLCSLFSVRSCPSEKEHKQAFMERLFVCFFNSYISSFDD